MSLRCIRLQLYGNLGPGDEIKRCGPIWVKLRARCIKKSGSRVSAALSSRNGGDGRGGEGGVLPGVPGYCAPLEVGELLLIAILIGNYYVPISSAVQVGGSLLRNLIACARCLHGKAATMRNINVCGASTLLVGVFVLVYFTTLSSFLSSLSLGCLLLPAIASAGPDLPYLIVRHFVLPPSSSIESRV